MPSISVLMLPLRRLVNAENGYYLVLSARYISDTSFATIHQKLDVSPRYISDTLRTHLVRGGSTIHQIFDVSQRYIKRQTIHLYISDTSKVMYHHPSASRVLTGLGVCASQRKKVRVGRGFPHHQSLSMQGGTLAFGALDICKAPPPQ